MLGYKRHNWGAYPKPSQSIFEKRVTALWNFLLQNADDRAGRKARLYILEALKSLRYYRRWWAVDSPLNEIGKSYDGGVRWDPPPPEDQPREVHPFRTPRREAYLEGPKGNVTVSKWEAARDCLMYPPLSSFNAPFLQGADADREEREIWHKYHPFYRGFCARDYQGVYHIFKAYPVPDPNSLWHCISLHMMYMEWDQQRDNNEIEGAGGPDVDRWIPNMMSSY